jgi:hypothetical protein
VKAKLGGPTGAAIGGGHSTNNHPGSVTIAAFDGKDFYGNFFQTEDIGAVAD